jgi:MoxR-like ATPase
MDTKIICDFRDKLIKNLEQVILGKTEALNFVIMGLICRGHLLIDDVPGVGKTILAKSLAISLGSVFHRIQFTPDMLPSDITGVSIVNQASKKIEFRPGPIIAEIILADEINRATPKTQSALLEAMEERQVTVDGVTHPLPKTFIVIETQNQIKYEGIFPLLKLNMGIKLWMLFKNNCRDLLKISFSSFISNRFQSV